MAWEPGFVTQGAQYMEEKKNVRTFRDWLAFSKRWFGTSGWPTKSPSQIEAEAKDRRSPVEIGGRYWSRVSYAYDISPEARYEYIATLRTLGDALRFPNEANAPRTAAEGWRQECPHCEIVTDEIGDAVCPQCGRRLVFDRRVE